MDPTLAAQDGAPDLPEVGRRWLRVAWLAVVVCAVTYVVGYQIETNAGLVLRHASLLTAAVLAALSTTIVWRRATRARYVKRFWGPLALALWLLVAGETYYAAYQLMVDARGPSWPSFYDAFNLLAAVSFAWLIVTMNRVGRLPPARRARVWAGIAGALSVSYVVLYWFIVEPIAVSNGYARVDAALWSLYVIEGILLIVLPFSTLFGLRVAGWRVWQRCVGAGLAVFGVVLMSVPFLLVNPEGAREGTGPMLAGVIYLSGYALLFLGALYRIADRQRMQPEGPLPAPHILDHPVVEVVLTGAAFVAIAIMSHAITHLPEDAFGRSVLFAGVAIVTAAITLRVVAGAAEMQTMRVTSSADPLTGALIRSALTERLGLLLRQARAEGRPLTLGVLDLDDFARFNVMRGRDVGDHLLAEMGKGVRGLLSSSEVFGRLGGDEFCVIFPGVDARDGVQRMIAISDGVGRLLRERDWPLTASGGVASVPEHAGDGDGLLRAADGALYWAKYGGKNRVVAYDDTVVRALDTEARLRELDARSRVDIVRALAAATDARDQATSYHSRNVAALCVMLTTALGLDTQRIEDIRLAAVLHDVGKIAVPDSVLRKRGRLSPGERSVLREHAETGARILASTELATFSTWVRGHHERWDGAGYPDGLAGEQIPYEARIIGLCNAYDMMLSGSSENPPLSHDAALQEIDQGIGAAYDPALAELFIRVISAHPSAAWSTSWVP